jgi:hypothetical protein
MAWNRGGKPAEKNFVWYGDQLLKYCADAGFYGCVRAAYFLRAYIRNMIGIPGFGVPSEKGDPPHLQSGKLKKSIKVLVSNQMDEAIVYSDQEYWFYLEYGTKNADGSERMAKRPFWRRSIDETQLTIQHVTKSAILEYMSGHIKSFDPHEDPFPEA